MEKNNSKLIASILTHKEMHLSMAAECDRMVRELSPAGKPTPKAERDAAIQAEIIKNPPAFNPKKK